MQREFHNAWLSVALCWFGAVVSAPAMAQTTTVAGITPGQFSVNESGAATYRIPIQVPPGVAGMEPKLELSYNSQGGNGLLGMGWSLSGLSTISRCPRTMAVDGARGGVNLDMNDRYCMDGQRLVLVSGTYGVVGSEYRTELDSFSKIVASGTAGNGVASFTVQTKAGLTMDYGNTADSRIEAQGKTTVRVWAINKISDVKTNFMTFSYYESADSSVYAPLNIDYGGNAAAGLPNSQSVAFLQDAARTDKNPGYSGGSLVQQDRRITGLTTYANGSPIKNYSMSYQPSPSTGRSRLESLTECVTGSLCLPPVSFSYGMAVNRGFATAGYWTAEYSDLGMWHSGEQYYGTLQYVDVNGDGLPDVCGRGGSGIECALNLGNGTGFGPKGVWAPGFSDPLGWNTAPYYSTIQYVDVNGDGLPDVCGRGGSGIECALNLGTGTGFGPKGMWAPGFSDPLGWNTAPYYSTIQYVDVNGDGLPDVCGRGGSGIECALNLGTGTGFGPKGMWAPHFSDPLGWNTAPYYSTIRYVDVNGDGLPDVCGRGGSGIECALNLGTGTGFGPKGMWAPAFSDPLGWDTAPYYSTIQYVDLNGDGLPDVCGRGGSGIECALNTGNGAGFGPKGMWAPAFSDPLAWNTPQYYSTIRYVDVNGDGLPDVCGRGGSGIECALNLGTGTGFGPKSMWAPAFSDPLGWDTAPYYSTIQYVDLNGDGLPDVCGRSGSGLLCAVLGSGTGDRIEGVSKNGQITTIALSSLAGNPVVYTKDVASNASVYPKLDLQYPQYVVSTVASSNGIGGTTTTQYSYGGLKAELGTGRGMLGFRWMKSRNLSNNIESYTEFNQNWPFTGSVAKSETRLIGSGNAGVLKRTTNSYAQGTGSATATTFVYPSQSIEESWDLGGSQYPTVTNSYQYGLAPQYGDPTQISVSNSAGAGKTTVNEYWPANTGSGNWILGRLKKATVISVAP